MDMMKLLLSEWNLLLMGAVWILMALAERVAPAAFEKGKWVNRLEPVFPVVICCICAMFIPGPWMPEGINMAQKAVLGVVLGAGSYNATGMAKRFGLTPFIANLKLRREKKPSESA
jgi:hypothetical protein